MQLTRREMLKMSLLGSAALLLPLERVARTRSVADRLPESMLPTPFEVPFAVPPLARLVGVRSPLVPPHLLLPRATGARGPM